MSADNTILVLKKDGKYQVAEVQAAENITQYRDEQSVVYFFGNKPKFATLEAALVVAQELEEANIRSDGYGTEYGIRVFEW